LYVTLKTNIMIKKLFALFVVVLLSNTAFSQKKVKVKGSRVISVENTPINSFERLLLQENFEVKLVQAEEASVEITTDEIMPKCFLKKN